MQKKKWTVYIPEMTSPKEPQREILEPIAELKFGYAKNEAELISIASKVDAIAVNMSTKMTRTVIEACPNLKIIAKYGVGLENVDIAAATDMGIPVTNNPGVNADAVAEVVIGLILSVIRRIQIGKLHIKERASDATRNFYGKRRHDSPYRFKQSPSKTGQRNQHGKEYSPCHSGEKARSEICCQS